MSINQWPSTERPRERLIHQGASHLSDAELLAILLNKGTRGKDAITLARDLLVQFRGVRGLFDASYRTITSQAGLGNAKYAQLQAALELSRRYLQETISRKTIIRHADSAKQFLMASLRHYEHEVFACLFLDNQHRVIQFEIMFHGSINSTSIHPREVVKRALYYNAAAMIFAHNHPSGLAQPSQADIDITQVLIQALALVDIRVLDHFIVGDGVVFSFAEEQLLPAVPHVK